MKKDWLMFDAKPSTRTAATIEASTILVFRWNMRTPGARAGRSSQSGGVVASTKSSRTAGGASGQESGPLLFTKAAISRVDCPRSSAASASTAASATGSPTTVCAR